MILSIDPGKSGAYCSFEETGELKDVVRIKVPLNQRFFDYDNLDYIWNKCVNENSLTVVMEMFADYKIKGQSIQATNTTACNHGILQAIPIVLGRPLHFVRASDWKRYFGLHKKDKKESINRATAYYDHSVFIPEGGRVPNVDMAEAFLIGRYWGENTLGWKHEA